MLVKTPAMCSGATPTQRAVVDADGLSVAVVGALVQGTLKAKSAARIEPGAPVVFTLAGGQCRDLRGTGLADGLRTRVKGPMLGRRLIATQVEFLP